MLQYYLKKLFHFIVFSILCASYSVLQPRLNKQSTEYTKTVYRQDANRWALGMIITSNFDPFFLCILPYILSDILGRSRFQDEDPQVTILNYFRVLSFITKTDLYNFDPFKPHFYVVKLGFTGVYIIFLISAQKHWLWVLVRTASARWF